MWWMRARIRRSRLAKGLVTVGVGVAIVGLYRVSNRGPGSTSTAADAVWNGMEGRGLSQFSALPALDLDSLKGIDLPSGSVSVRAKDGIKRNMAVVLAAQHRREVGWTENRLDGWTRVVYLAGPADGRSDDRPEPTTANLVVHRSPVNKGNEAMAFLSYIIDYYDNLPDLVVFAHHHRVSWHNNDLLNFDLAEMVDRLQPDGVLAMGGYSNLRCHWDPGCPASLLEGTGGELLSTVAETSRMMEGEQTALTSAWSVLFPSSIFPAVPSPESARLASPCCSQFAASRDRIQAVPLTHWISVRKWLAESPLSDALAGRVLEHSWHRLLAVDNPMIECPVMSVCYCRLYRMCFPSEQAFRAWFRTRMVVRRLGDIAAGHRPADGAVVDDNYRQAVAAGLVEPDSPASLRGWLENRIGTLTAQLDSDRRDALFRGLGQQPAM